MIATIHSSIVSAYAATTDGADDVDAAAHAAATASVATAAPAAAPAAAFAANQAALHPAMFALAALAVLPGAYSADAAASTICLRAPSESIAAAA